MTPVREMPTIVRKGIEFAVAAAITQELSKDFLPLEIEWVLLAHAWLMGLPMEAVIVVAEKP